MSEKGNVCKYCKKEVDVKSDEFIQLRRKDGTGEPFWVCRKCYKEKGFQPGYSTPEVPL